jgi:hypothetical protein
MHFYSGAPMHLLAGVDIIFRSTLVASGGAAVHDAHDVRFLHDH